MQGLSWQLLYPSLDANRDQAKLRLGVHRGVVRRCHLYPSRKANSKVC